MKHTPHIAVFGEMLWDLLPTGKQPGGAPMNVAVHLHNLGIKTSLIRRVGKDKWGKELTQFLQDRALSTEWIQEDANYPTGTVNVNVDDAEEVQYEIVAPVAWDYIRQSNGLLDRVESSDIFIYETLAAREATSKETLLSLLKVSSFNVLDVNLRPPFYNRDLLTQLFYYADLLKINHQELAKISGWMGQFESDQQRAEMLIQRFDIQGVIITRGANGALFIPAEGNPTAHRGYKITVADTIGAGDSFLAAFLSRWVQKASIAECLDFACGLGALVASHKGANPSLSVADIEAFIQAQKG